MKSAVLHGPGHRVQLSVLDHSTPKTWLVYALPAHYDKATAFRVCGTQLYFGESPADAWVQVLRFAPGAEFPPRLEKFRLPG
jgi:hypothetical protein